MTVAYALDWYRELLWLAVLIGGPVVLSAVTVGLLVAVVQAATQVNDSAVAFAPKALAVVAALAVSGSWMLGRMSEFATHAISAIERMHP
jgi:flagellar biosynthetic protein FliQ